MSFVYKKEEWVSSIVYIVTLICFNCLKYYFWYGMKVDQKYLKPDIAAKDYVILTEDWYIYKWFMPITLLKIKNILKNYYNITSDLTIK